MTFREYYGAPFLDDLSIFHAWAAASSASHKEDLDGVFAIQPHLLQEHSQEIAIWSSERAAFFATALFFTVLVDQVCYTHFRHAYPEFEHLTRYPKLRGLCPGGCQNRDPKDIFSWLSKYFLGVQSELEHAYEHAVYDALPVIKEEVFTFFQRHLSSINAVVFWDYCKDHVPMKHSRGSDIN